MRPRLPIRRRRRPPELSILVGATAGRESTTGVVVIPFSRPFPFFSSLPSFLLKFSLLSLN